MDKTVQIKQDFRNFLSYVWKYLNLPKPTELQYDAALFMQNAPRRTIIQAYRGFGKSWITSAFACWTLLNNPQMRILVVSASRERADAFSTFTKRLIYELPLLQHLIPSRHQRTSNIAFDVLPAKPDHAPSVKSVGITGMITGSRANLIIADDIETPNNSYTQMQRDRLAEVVKEFDSVIKPGGKILFLGTPQTEMSLYNTLVHRGYQCIIWTARYPSLKQERNMEDKLAPLLLEKLEQDSSLRGKPTDPLRFDDDDLTERELSYGKSGFALQFMLDTSLSDADKYPLKLSDLIITTLDPERAPSKIIWSNNIQYRKMELPACGLNGDYYYNGIIPHDIPYIPYQLSVLAIDPSGRGKDETGYAVVKFINGILYLRKAGGLKGGYDDDTLKKLAMIAQQEKVNKIVIESNFGDGMFSKLFTPVLTAIYPCSIEEVRHQTQKEKRIIDTLEPIMNRHKLVVDEEVIKEDVRTEDFKRQLFYQMTRLSADKGSLTHDDRLDALSIACKFFTDNLDRDADRALIQYRENQVHKQFQDFINSFHKQKNSSSSSWLEDYDTKNLGKITAYSLSNNPFHNKSI